jgi:thiamine biosynthesis lipoprotein
MAVITTVIIMTTMIMMTMTMMTINQSVDHETAVWEWFQYQFRAMNTDIQFSVIAPKPRSLVRIVVESFDYFERLLSRFRPDSELSRLNESKGLIFQASPDFFAAIEASLWAAQQTSGIYDPTILGYLEAAGYDRTFGAVPNPRPLSKKSSAVEPLPDFKKGSIATTADLGYQDIELDAFTETISLPSGLRIDLGGMGKGWTVDRAADLLCGKGHFLLNAGGDLYAYGSSGLDKGWVVHLAHPTIPGKDYASLMVDRHAVTTSTIARRRWVKNGIIQHHLIDPRSGLPAQTDVISASVIAGRAFTAEIFAKAALILGVEEGLAFLESLPEVDGVLYSNKNEIYRTSQMDRYLLRMNSTGYENH